ncbi:Gfo/Idh/MocA family protein [Sinorhizobium fredii]|uniref:Oxidoreductase domain-containing protein n=1 Tax=Rhizobium fredii TaxID=380 RepID=A0A2L0HCX8_RHIFR|nr:Gfo/Idh/MocA family oxidoreductase [Sinorhizobium fredii]AUX79360.1 oxidoreductase domain-containing protein [Sinorhizobium fredii]
MTKEKLKLGVIGCGRIAQAAHFPAVQKARNVELAAVFDPSGLLAKGAGLRLGVPAYTDQQEFLNADIDAVLIAIPDRFHVPVSIAALQAGRHVLVEKPVAVTAAEAKTLIEVLGKTGLQLQVGSMKRFDPGIARAQQVIAEGGIGRILSARCWYRVMSELRPPIEATLFPAMLVDQDVRNRETALKAANRKTHLLATHGIHTFDLMRFLLGELTVSAATMAVDGVDHSWHGIATTDAGAAASFEITASVHAEWTEGFQIYGSKGHISAEIPFPFSRAASRVRIFRSEQSSYEEPIYGDTDAYKLQVEAFAAAILEGSAVEPNARDGLKALEIVETVNALTAREEPDQRKSA